MSLSRLFSLVSQGDEQEVKTYLLTLNKDKRAVELDQVQHNLFWHESTDRYRVEPGGYEYYQWNGWYTQDLSDRYRANTPRALNPDLVEKVLKDLS